MSRNIIYTYIGNDPHFCHYICTYLYHQGLTTSVPSMTYSHVFQDGLSRDFVAGPDGKDGAGLLVLNLISHNLLKNEFVSSGGVSVAHTINKCFPVNLEKYDRVKMLVTISGRVFESFT